MKRILLTFLIILCTVFAFAGVDYDETTKTLTILNLVHIKNIIIFKFFI